MSTGALIAIVVGVLVSIGMSLFAMKKKGAS